MFQLILSQGRVGDRAPRLIQGAAQTAAAISAHYDVRPRTVGTPSPEQHDDWTESLPAAKATLEAVAAAVEETLGAGRPPVVVAGTCSSGLGTMPVVARHHPDVAVLYVDGHGDFNTPGTTGTGYLGGMVLSGVCGLWDNPHGAGVHSDLAVLLGARDVDADEAALIERAGVRVLTPGTATAELLAEALGSSPVWVHIDWDVLEPGYVPADYSVASGFTPDALRELLAAIPAAQIVGIEMGEFQPTEDDEVDRRSTDTIVRIVQPVLDALAARD